MSDLALFTNRLRDRLGLDPLYAFSRSGKPQHWATGQPAEPHDPSLLVFANGLRDAMGLVPLYTWDARGRCVEWQIGMPYRFYPPEAS